MSEPLYRPAIDPITASVRKSGRWTWHIRIDCGILSGPSRFVIGSRARAERAARKMIAQEAGRQRYRAERDKLEFTVSEDSQ